MDQVHVIRHKVLVEGLSARRVAREMGVSRNTVQSRLKRLEEGGLLTGYRPELDLAHAEHRAGRTHGELLLDATAPIAGVDAHP